MQITYLRTLDGTLVPPQSAAATKTATQSNQNDLPRRVCGISAARSGLRVAVAGWDRFITLFDEEGNFRERFPTKPADKPSATNGADGTASQQATLAPTLGLKYVIRGVEFGPDGTKLAVAQSDNIVFVYKLGATWNDKKTICNKFHQLSSVTTVTWPTCRPNEVVIGLADGKVRFGNLKTNKSSTLYSADSYTVSSCSNPDGHSFVTGHVDGQIYRYTFADADTKLQVQLGTPKLLVTVPYAPTALAWGDSIVAAGNSPIVRFYDYAGQLLQQFDYSKDENVRDFTTARFSPSGQSVVVGNYDRFFLFNYNKNKSQWEEAGMTIVENFYSVTALAWKNDGSRLLVGSLGGAVDMYDVCLKRVIYKQQWELTYTSSSSLILKRLATDARLALKSKFNSEIVKVRIYKDRFCVMHTTKTLIIADLDHALVSEIPWNEHNSGKDRFNFDNEGAVMIFSDGELSIIALGKDEVIGSARTEYTSQHLLSIRINDGVKRSDQAIKKIAFLLDSQAIRVVDLVTQAIDATVNHDSVIDWLELNQRATKLLFRDKRRALHLYDIPSQTRTTLLSFCKYVQWVPDSDVCVAQSRGNLCVWYSIDNPFDVTTIPIKGDVQEIERGNGKTEVIVDEGMSQAVYTLDEGLIAFGAAIDMRNFQKAIGILESLPQSARGVEAMWTQLSQLALQEGDYIVAEHCYSALGNAGKARFLHRIKSLTDSQNNNKDHYMVLAALAIFNRQFKRAEAILLQHGNVEEAIVMYQQLHKWDDAIAVAESRGHPSARQLRIDFFQYLISTKQEERAGELKEREGNYDEALQLYLKGGYPLRAAQLFLSKGNVNDSHMVDTIVNALQSSKSFEQLGDFLCQLHHNNRALEAYRRGHAYAKAVELCRRDNPSEIVRLEEEWGDWLVSQKQTDAASNHYIQAGAYIKAINAALDAMQWTKAVQILDPLEPSIAKPYYKQIAAHFAESKKYAEAEKYYILSGAPQDAVFMYTNANMWDKVRALASTYMGDDKVLHLVISQAQKLEVSGKLKEAEYLYISVNEVDLAISMYKKARAFDDMIRLVEQYRKDLLGETHLQLAKQMEQESNLKGAETHYVAAKQWPLAIKMFRDADQWEDALRVAKTYGSQTAYRQQVYDCALSANSDASVRLLQRQNLGEIALEFALEKKFYPEAFVIAKKACPDKIPDTHLSYAMSLEDDGLFEKAEEHFILAGKPREAIEMHLHQENWDAALRIAEEHEPAMLSEVYGRHGKSAVDAQNYGLAEQLFVEGAKKPEFAVRMYQNAGMLNDAIRVAKLYVPSLVQQLQQMQRSSSSIQSKTGSTPKNAALAESEDKEEDNSAYGQQNERHSKSLDQETHPVPSAMQKAIDVNNWDEVYRLAARESPDVVERYVSMHAALLIKEGKYRDALAVFTKHGAPVTPANFVVYKRLSLEILGNPEYAHCTNANEQNIYDELRDMLFSILKELIEIDTASDNTKEFHQLWLIAYYSALRYLASGLGLTQIEAKIAISLLRYTRVVPADKAFYDAGDICKNQGWFNNAFVFLNRFVDLVDRIEDEDNGDIDNTDFMETDIPPPSEIPLPKHPFYSGKIVNEARDWVLDHAMSKDVEKSLTMRSCEKCSRETYDAGLQCHSCHHQYQACVVTGYPVLSKTRITCRSCHSPANREDWNRWVQKTRACPQCGNAQMPSF